MVRIRLAVKGRKNNRSFSIIVIDQKMSRDSGRFLEVLGHYDPRNKELKLNREKINN
jgi:small subunit ribosomal protein S16